MAPVERHIEEALYRSAVELIERRYPNRMGRRGGDATRRQRQR